MTKEDLKNWMGFQDVYNGKYNVSVAVDCGNPHVAQEVADTITDIFGRKRFDTDAGSGQWWRWIFLEDKPDNKDRCINAYSSVWENAPTPMLPNAGFISAERFLGIVGSQGVHVVRVEDML